MSNVKIHDYSSQEVKNTVVMMVRPTHRYMTANAGERVRIDKDELRRGPTRETLCTEEEYQHYLSQVDKARAVLLAEKPEPTSDAIAQQIEAAGRAAEEKRAREAQAAAAALSVSPPPVAPSAPVARPQAPAKRR